MKKLITLTILLIVLICAGFVAFGAMRASVMTAISDDGMMLVSDTTDTSDFDSKLYELAYSSPIASEKIGLWLEAILAKDFETFSANEKAITLEMVTKLKGWPINRAAEIDLSNSQLTDESFAKLGTLSSADWIDLSGTKITAETLAHLPRTAPKLRKLQLKNTSIIWTPTLVTMLLKTLTLREVEIDPNQIDPKTLIELNSALAKRENSQ